MSIVVQGGAVLPGDSIKVELPSPPHTPLIYRTPQLEVRITSIHREAEGIHSLELRTLDCSPLPPFTAGAHINLMLTPDLVRSYSLSNDPHQRGCYVVSVNKDPKSRGGSKHVHEQLRVSDRLQISPARNNFRLDETAKHTVLVAGGIGITALRSMIYRLDRVGLSWELYYATKSRTTTAFLDEFEHLEKANPGHIHFHFSTETKGVRLDLSAIIATAPDPSHFYCCGPLAMIAAFEAETAGLPRRQVHTEYFAAKSTVAAEGGFKIVLQRSQKTLEVLAGTTILDTLLAADVDVPILAKRAYAAPAK